MKISAILTRDRLLLIFLWMVVATCLLEPLSSSFFLPQNEDYFNHAAILMQAKLGLMEGQFPLRVVPLEHNGWRYPLFQFYSPTGYMLASLIYYWFTPASSFLTLKITMWVFLVMGGAYMYKLSKWMVSSREAAILASVVYITSPYFIIVIDHLYSFNEALALGVVPAALYYTFQRYYHPTENKTLLQVAIVWYLLATLHLITFFYTSFFTGLLLILATLKNRKWWLNLLDTGIAYFFGVVLALWYLAPIYVFNNYLQVKNYYGLNGFFDRYNPSFSNLISPSRTILQGSTIVSGQIDSIDAIHPSLGLPLLFGVVVCFYVLLSKSKFASRKANEWIVPLLIIFIISFIMVWSPFGFSELVPKTLRVGQYSWRVLGQVIWVSTLLFACGSSWLFKNNLDVRHVVLGLFIVMLATSAWIPIKETRVNSEYMDGFEKKPFLVSNQNMYLIDVKNKDNLGLIYGVDTIDIGSLLNNDNDLILNKIYRVPLFLFNTAFTPVLRIEGLLPSHYKFPVQEISVLVNGSILSSFKLKSGPFDWQVPLASFLKNSAKNASALTLEFRTNIRSNEKISMPIGKISIGGFQNPNETMLVKEVQASCEQKSVTTICRFQVSPKIKLIELPVLYYPDLLSITLNGKVVPYNSMLYQDMLITTIKPEPGVLNTIKIEFRGLVWANTLSEFGWGLWVFFLLYVTLKQLSANKPFSADKLS